MALNLPDEKWMRRCIQLAKNGRQSASPNPMVGAVIVHDDKIIGEGWHRECGTPHAEVNAVRSVRFVVQNVRFHILPLIVRNIRRIAYNQVKRGFWLKV